MIPLRDNIQSRTTPLVNYVIIGICSLAFLVQLASGDGGNTIVEQYGLVPLRLTDPQAKPVIRQRVQLRTARGIEDAVIVHELAPPAIPVWLTLVSCMFLHGGWMHFLGNMWFLYIFGDNVEDRLGHAGYLLIYLGTGIAAGMAHYATDNLSVVPTIGASGAIAGVMGAYAWLYPHARVQAVLPLFVIIQVFVLPAPVFFGIWFAIQTFSGISASASGQAVGVAWWAHIGGFIAGAVVALVVGRAHLGREALEERRF
jgi:membrane associated rhomboid family serine protease